ncbi:hypothetical protein ACQKFU_22700 [Bacillus mycoides]|uniref:hypothetical protein n=1 Tax=Bacillus TaxID=1386 RepID=UPI003832D5C2
MKNVMKVLFVLSLALTGSLLTGEKADAAWSSWQSVPNAGSSCKVRVHTNATNYSASAKTVDAVAESQGNCGTLYYDMHLLWKGLESVSIDSASGYFASSTPTKSLKIKSLTPETNNTVVKLVLYNKSNKYLGDAYSESITIAKR